LLRADTHALNRIHHIFLLCEKGIADIRGPANVLA
jgi:hypothetical protein